MKGYITEGKWNICSNCGGKVTVWFLQGVDYSSQWVHESLQHKVTCLMKQGIPETRIRARIERLIESELSK